MGTDDQDIQFYIYYNLIINSITSIRPLNDEGDQGMTPFLASISPAEILTRFYMVFLSVDWRQIHESFSANRWERPVS